MLEREMYYIISTPPNTSLQLEVDFFQLCHLQDFCSVKCMHIAISISFPHIHMMQSSLMAFKFFFVFFCLLYNTSLQSKSTGQLLQRMLEALY